MIVVCRMLCACLVEYRYYLLRVNENDDDDDDVYSYDNSEATRGRYHWYSRFALTTANIMMFLCVFLVRSTQQERRNSTQTSKQEFINSSLFHKRSQRISFNWNQQIQYNTIKQALLFCNSEDSIKQTSRQSRQSRQAKQIKSKRNKNKIEIEIVIRIKSPWATRVVTSTKKHTIEILI